MLKKKKIQIYLKNLAYNFFKIIYGEIDGKIFPSQENDIISKSVKIDEQEYKVYYCNKSRLYTDRVHDTAIIKQNKIIDGPSFQYRNNKDENCELNSVFTKGTPRIKKKLNGTIFSLLTGGGGNTNYWHWLFDVLPRLHILEKSNIDNLDIKYYLFPNLDKKFQKETLNILNIPIKKRLSSKNIRHVFSDQIIVSSHPYNLLNDPSLDSLNIPNWIFEFLRKKFCVKIIQDEKIVKQSPKKIYINRKDGNPHRFIINEKEVEESLKKKGFTSLTLSEYSFSEQINLFYNAEYVVGLHGAGFANIIFCKPNTKIIEFKSLTAGDIIKNLAIQNKLTYKDISSKNKLFTYSNQSGDIEVDIKLLNSILNF
jgi:capsular polysaccharide biosynthesis protein